MFNPFVRVKSERVKLRALTSTPRLAEVLPVIKLSKALPNWWRNLPSTFDDPPPPDPRMPPHPQKQMSAKHCYAMQEVFKNGLGIPLWADHLLCVTPEGRAHAHAPGKGMPGDQHPPQQFAGMLSPSSVHFKFHSPWWLIADRPMHFWMCHPFYHQRDPFRFQTMPGAVEYHNQHSTNVNVILPRPAKTTEIEFAAGEMIAYLMPMEDVRIDLVVEEVTEAEIDRVNFTKFITARPLLFNRMRRKQKGQETAF
jgi:hypothetical protein